MRAKTTKGNLCDKCKFCPAECGATELQFGNEKGNDNVVECYSFKTDIKDLFFRSSKIGLLAGGLIRHGLTVKQREEMEMLEGITNQVVGLSDKQQADLDAWDSKSENGATLTPNQMEKRGEYRSRLTRKRELTPAQSTRLKELKEKHSRPPELSQGAKTYIKQVWLENEKGFKEEVTDKKLRKGLQGEEDAISLISFVDNRMYMKNKKCAKKHHLTGTCDVITMFKDMPTEEGKSIDALVIDDTKCSWNPRTFMQADLTVGYEWQGRAYLYLYDADIFRLRHCLVDCPPDVYADEYRKFCFQHGIIDDSSPEYKEVIDQFKRNYLYENTGMYTRRERVKTFMFERDYELEEVLLTSIDLAVEYYQTITLNMIED